LCWVALSRVHGGALVRGVVERVRLGMHVPAVHLHHIRVERHLRAIQVSVHHHVLLIHKHPGWVHRKHHVPIRRWAVHLGTRRLLYGNAMSVHKHHPWPKNKARIHRRHQMGAEMIKPRVWHGRASVCDENDIARPVDVMNDVLAQSRGKRVLLR